MLLVRLMVSGCAAYGPWLVRCMAIGWCGVWHLAGVGNLLPPPSQSHPSVQVAPPPPPGVLTALPIGVGVPGEPAGSSRGWAAGMGTPCGGSSNG